MRTDRFVHSSRIEVPAEFAFAWHERPGALERLTPPWDRVAVRERAGSIHDGDRVVLALGAGPLSPAGRVTMAGEPACLVEVPLPADVPPLRARLEAAGVATFEAD
ncbi:MAG TPA: hypothetical protein PLU25_14030, partial [Acidobacteriota bacterium]|nr:hypothetical protein [Acidobacteriota bacterium]